MGSNPPTFQTKQRPRKLKKARLWRAHELSSYIERDGWPASEAESSAGLMFDSLAQAWCMIRCKRCASRERDRRRRQERADAGEAVPERTKCRERILATLKAGGMSGEDAAVMAYWLEILEDDGCERCHGTGWEGPVRITEAMRNNPDITAFPTGSSNNGRPAPTVIMAPPDAAEWERYGAIGNLLGALREQHPLEAEALELYRAPGNARISVLWPLTEAGRALQNASNGARTALTEAANEQAAELLERATTLWNALADASIQQRRERRGRGIRDRARANRGRGRR